MINNATCAPTINPKIKYIFGGSISFKYARKLRIKNAEVLIIPYAISSHCNTGTGMIQSKKIGIKQLKLYP